MGWFAKAGTKLRARLLLTGMHRQVEDPAALAARIRDDYGLAGKTSYTVTAEQGKVVAKAYLGGLHHCYTRAA